MSEGSFSHSRRALSSLQSSENTYAHFQFKGFDPIRRSDVLAVVFIWTALLAYMNFGEFLEKTRFLMKINSSWEATSEENTYQILAVRERNGLDFFITIPKKIILETFVIYGALRKYIHTWGYRWECELLNFQFQTLIGKLMCACIFWGLQILQKFPILFFSESLWKIEQFSYPYR